MIMSEDSVGDEPKKKRGRPKGTKSKPKAETQTIETPKEKSKVEASENVLTAAEVAAPGNSFTHNRGAEQIFRREMGEPEFWLDKLGRAPKRTILSQDEEQEISRLVEIPTDQIPPYKA